MRVIPWAAEGLLRQQGRSGVRDAQTTDVTSTTPNYDPVSSQQVRITQHRVLVTDANVVDGGSTLADCSPASTLACDESGQCQRLSHADSLRPNLVSDICMWSLCQRRIERLCIQLADLTLAE